MGIRTKQTALREPRRFAGPKTDTKQKCQNHGENSFQSIIGVDSYELPLLDRVPVWTKMQKQRFEPVSSALQFKAKSMQEKEMFRSRRGRTPLRLAIEMPAAKHPPISEAMFLSHQMSLNEGFDRAVDMQAARSYNRTWEEIEDMLDRAELTLNDWHVQFLDAKGINHKRGMKDAARNYKALEGVVKTLKWVLGERGVDHPLE